jgi:hypothetical protein
MRRCDYCNQEFTPHNHVGHPERTARYCSRRCAGKAHQEEDGYQQGIATPERIAELMALAHDQKPLFPDGPRKRFNPEDD